MVMVMRSGPSCDFLRSACTRAVDGMMRNGGPSFNHAVRASRNNVLGHQRYRSAAVQPGRSNSAASPHFEVSILSPS
jgi:hypothetical protein